MISCKINFKYFKKFINTAIIIITNNRNNLINIRYSIMPYTKWHSKHLFIELLNKKKKIDKDKDK